MLIWTEINHRWSLVRRVNYYLQFSGYKATEKVIKNTYRKHRSDFMAARAIVANADIYLRNGGIEKLVNGPAE